MFPLEVQAATLGRLRTKEHDSLCGSFGRWHLHESTNIRASFIQIHFFFVVLLLSGKCVLHLSVCTPGLTILQRIGVILQMLCLLA